MKVEKNLRTNKGITLIALIITVIVMIILAGITINLTIGDNGIFKKTEVAAEEHRGGTVEEQRDLWRADRELYKHVEGNGVKSLDELLVELRAKNFLTDEEVEIIKKDKVITIGSHVIDFTLDGEIVYSKLAPGLYQTGTTNLIKSWDKLKEDGDITVEEDENGKKWSKAIAELDGDLVISSEITVIGNAITGSTCGTGGTGEVSNITKVYIPSSVKQIGYSAFAQFEKMKEVIIDGEIETIGIYAFYGCKTLETINLPNSVKNISGGVFAECSALSNITIPNSVEAIDYNAFEGCSALEEINIPNGVTRISAAVFKGCSSLKHVNIPNNVTAIWYNAFEGCTALTTITIPDGVTRIWRYAFKGCSALSSINIPNTVTTIDYNAFEGCTALSNITIPSSVTTMESNVFKNWTTSQTINIQFKMSEIPSGWAKKTSSADGWNSNCNARIRYAT